MLSCRCNCSELSKWCNVYEFSKSFELYFTWQLVSESLMSLFSTNMAISETSLLGSNRQSGLVLLVGRSNSCLQSYTRVRSCLLTSLITRRYVKNRNLDKSRCFCSGNGVVYYTTASLLFSSYMRQHYKKFNSNISRL